MNNRIRLINCPEMVCSIRDVINSPYGVIEKEDKYGCWEIKLNGKPWHCSRYRINISF